MRVAVLTLTRDRLQYSKHCFATLADNSGVSYDHYVLDQGSTDGTVEWLCDTFYDDQLILLEENVGINRGLNLLLDELVDPSEYDVLVKIDNDCELLQPYTLRDVCRLTLAGNALLSPTVLGLNNPPATIGEFDIDGEPIDEKHVIGGIFLAAPATMFQAGYRHPEDAPLHGSDDWNLSLAWRKRGGRVGYVRRLNVYHYETTDGQHQRYPDYFARTLAEGKPSL